MEVDNEEKPQTITTFHSIPSERKAQIFDLLSFEDKINVSNVCREWTIVVQFTSNIKFTTTLDNENLKFVAERCCPLELLKIENWTSILREDFTMQTLLSPVNEVRLKGGISPYNLNALLGSDGGTVAILSFNRSFFSNRLQNSFPSKPGQFKWNYLSVLKFKVPGSENASDIQHLAFVEKLFKKTKLPQLSDFSIELGRKIGADASRVNRTGRFSFQTFVTFVGHIFEFIVTHQKTIENLKLYFLLNVQHPKGIPSPEDGLEISDELKACLLNLKLKTIQFRYYNNNIFGIPHVKYLVGGKIGMTHIEVEQFGSLGPEVYAAVEQNAATLKTVVLEVRMNAYSDPRDDPFRHLHSLTNCKSLVTLHLRGTGVGIKNVEGVPTGIINLRIGLMTEMMYSQNEGLKNFLEWISANLTKLETLQIGDIENSMYANVTSLVAAVYMHRSQNFKSMRYLETNWFGDYSRVKATDYLSPGPPPF